MEEERLPTNVAVEQQNYELDSLKQSDVFNFILIIPVVILKANCLSLR